MGVPVERRRYAGVDLHELREARRQQANRGVAERAALGDDAPEVCLPWSPARTRCVACVSASLRGAARTSPRIAP